MFSNHTGIIVPINKIQNTKSHFFEDLPMMYDSPVMFAMGGAEAGSGPPPPPSPNSLKPVGRVRKIFPETWMWLNETIP